MQVTVSEGKGRPCI